jgi:VIT1/CCC1 family predicted Fe2+/Mn2+ transporter
MNRRKHTSPLRKKVLHQEKNSGTGAVLSEVILGGQDGLVNTLGVILGLAAASADLRIIVAGGLAGAIAEAVSMAAVGYTSTVAERDFYLGEMEHEKLEIENMPDEEAAELREIYEKKGFRGPVLEEMVRVITADKKLWLETMMREELHLSPVDGINPFKSAALIGISSFLGAALPWLPFAVFYFAGWQFTGAVGWAIWLALIISALALFAAGVVKSRLTIGKWYRSGLDMLLIGILSALTGYAIGAIFSVQV